MLAPNTSIPGAPGGQGPPLALMIISSIADGDCMGVLYPPDNAGICGSCAPLRFDWCSDGADADCDAVDSYFECVQCEHAVFKAHLANITECAEFADEIHTKLADGHFGVDNIFEATCGGTPASISRRSKQVTLRTSSRTARTTTPRKRKTAPPALSPPPASPSRWRPCSCK